MLLALIAVSLLLACCCLAVTSYISNGWATQNLINPDGCSICATLSSEPSVALSFNEKWVNIKNTYSKPDDVPSFNHGHMISYFVSRIAADGLPSGDIKSINTVAKHLYDCGHVQSIEVGSTDDSMYIRATGISEM